MTRKPYYGIIGNGETCALISPEGSIDWLCLPKFDGKLVYTKALDPRNGRSLGIKFFKGKHELLPAKTRQEYIRNTNVLKSIVVYNGFSVDIFDFMPWGERIIFRILKIKNLSNKKLKLTMKMFSGTRNSQEEIKKDIFYSKKFSIGKLQYDNAEIVLGPNNYVEKKLAIVYGTGIEKRIARIRHMDPKKEMKDCISFWQNWIECGKTFVFDNKDKENIFYRSLLVIKLLTYDRSGAILAAATAAFPAVPAGNDNWDYRYAWIRDNYFAARALLRTGHYEEVKKMLEFFYNIQGDDGHWKSPLYTLDGKKLGKEVIIKELVGPDEEDILRLQNAAKEQLQLDSEGSIIHTTYLYYLYTKDNKFLRSHLKNIKKAAEWIAKNHDLEENGIWEFREKQARYTYGKIMCYVALESSIKIFDALNIRNYKLEKIKNILKKEILKNSWSCQRNAFLQTYDNDAAVDISVIALEDYGIIGPKDTKMKKTIELIKNKLVNNLSVKRYENAKLPFYMPTLWLASHYIRLGDKKTAVDFINNAINASTELYLCAEHFDPENGRQYGNFPQTFCASMFIEKILDLKESRINILQMLDTIEEDIIKNFFFDPEKLVK